MSKQDLKSALSSLQVKKPLKLSAAPVFQAPKPPASLDEINTGVSKPSPVELNTGVHSSTPDASLTPVQNTTGVDSKKANHSEVSTVTPACETTPIENNTRVPYASPVCHSTPDVLASPVDHQTRDVEQPGLQSNPGSIPRCTQPRRATEQDRAVTLATEANPKLMTGYTRLPNAILMRMAAGEMSRVEMQLVLLLARLTISYQRTTVPLSKSVIERMTGVQAPTATQALRRLESGGLITRIPGDAYRPNEFGLIFDETALLHPAKQSPFDASPVFESTPVVFNTGVVNSTGVQSRTGVVNPTPFKDNKNIKTITSLSSQSEKLSKFFAELKPMKKRESEWMEYQGLRADFSDADISDCLEHVMKKGVPAGEGAFAPCHSPMAYLAKAMTAVLTEVQAEREKVRARTEREFAVLEAQRREQEESERERHEWEIKERAFNRAFPSQDSQREVITELCQGLPFRPDGMAARTLSIGKWWDGLSGAAQMELQK